MEKTSVYRLDMRTRSHFSGVDRNERQVGVARDLLLRSDVNHQSLTDAVVVVLVHTDVRFPRQKYVGVGTDHIA